MDVSIGFAPTQHLDSSPPKYGPLPSRDWARDCRCFNAIMATLAAMFYCKGTEHTMVSDDLGFLPGIGAEPGIELIVQGESHSSELLDEISRGTKLLPLEGAASQNPAYAEIDLEAVNIPGPITQDERLSTLMSLGKARITSDAVAGPALEVGARLERAVSSISGGIAERVPASPPRQFTDGHNPGSLEEAAVCNNQELPCGNAAIIGQEPGEEPADSRNDKEFPDCGLVTHDITRDKAHGARAESIVHPAVDAFEIGVRNEPSKALVKNSEEVAKVLAQNRYANPSKTVEIQLDPPNLGKVTVLLSSRGEEIAVKFITSSHETQQALANSQESLAQALSERGLSLSGFLVDQGMAGQRNQAHRDFSRERMASYGPKQIGVSHAAADEWNLGNSEVFSTARFDYKA